jgi:hypothetical protein
MFIAKHIAYGNYINFSLCCQQNTPDITPLQKSRMLPSEDKIQETRLLYTTKILA